MTAKIQVRRDTNSAFAAVTLAAGEFGLATDLRQLKIGDGSTVWTSLPWLSGTLPVFTSPNTDANDASNRVQGVYRFANASAITNGPSAPINIVANDGGATMLVIVADSHVVQQLWTDGNGSTQVPKSYSRVYDHGSTAWRPWTAQSSWGIASGEGVDLIANSITLKNTSTGLTVDGNSTLTGDVTVNGTTTLGNASTDIVTVQAGTAAAPIITTSGDLDTGIAFTAANTIALSTGGTARVTIANASTAIANDLNFSGQLLAAFNCGTHRLTNIGAPTSANDAMRFDDLISQGCISIAYLSSLTPGMLTQSGTDGTTWTYSNPATSSQTISAAAGTWAGICIGFDGGGNLYGIDLNMNSGPSGSFVITNSSVNNVIVIAYRKRT